LVTGFLQVPAVVFHGSVVASQSLQRLIIVQRLGSSVMDDRFSPVRARACGCRCAARYIKKVFTHQSCSEITSGWVHKTCTFMFQPPAMKQIILKPLLHRDQERIAIYFEFDKPLQQLIQKQAGAFYSKTHHCWYVTLNKENYEQLMRVLKDKASIEKSALRQYLATKKKTTAQKPVAAAVEKPTAAPIPYTPPRPIAKQAVTAKTSIHPVNQHVLTTMRQALLLKAYSPFHHKNLPQRNGNFHENHTTAPGRFVRHPKN
jgi:hypothetical protein